jgi:hypothetical protein
VTPTATGARGRLHQVEERLDPTRARSWAIEELEELFRSGHPPEPSPDGLLRGRAISSTITPGFDALTRRVASLYMPWMGKKFDPQAKTGRNVLAKSALKPMKLFWPAYEPIGIFVDRVEAFSFKTRIDPGAVDPGLRVLKIDYDFGANPSFIIRRVLDELVQIEEDLWLGKVLFRLRGEFHQIGFFALER